MAAEQSVSPPLPCCLPAPLQLSQLPPAAADRPAAAPRPAAATHRPHLCRRRHPRPRPQPGALPCRSATFSAEVEGRPTEFALTGYSDRLLVVASQLGSLGSVLAAHKEAVLGGGSTFQVDTLLGEQEKGAGGAPAAACAAVLPGAVEGGPSACRRSVVSPPGRPAPECRCSAPLQHC